jgi:hypothetical protein
MIHSRGYVGSITQLRRVVAELRPPQGEAFLRLRTFPGEHYGKFRVMLRNASSGVRRAAAGWWFCCSRFP